MSRVIRSLTAVAVGALAALAPAAAALATDPKATLTVTAACVRGGWTATFTFSNNHPAGRTALITHIVGPFRSDAPVEVVAGDSVSYTSPPLVNPRASASFTYRFVKPSPAPSSPAPTSPAPTSVPPSSPAPESPAPTSVPPSSPAPTAPTSTPVSVPPVEDSDPPVEGSAGPVPLTAQGGGNGGGKTVTAIVVRPVCPTASPTTAPSPTTDPTPTGPAPVPTDNASGGDALPVTGSAAVATALLGAVLLGGGIFAVMAFRRRRTTFSA